MRLCLIFAYFTTSLTPLINCPLFFTFAIAKAPLLPTISTPNSTHVRSRRHQTIYPLIGSLGDREVGQQV